MKRADHPSIYLKCPSYRGFISFQTTHKNTTNVWVFCGTVVLNIRWVFMFTTAFRELPNGNCGCNTWLELIDNIPSSSVEHIFRSLLIGIWIIKSYIDHMRWWAMVRMLYLGNKLNWPYTRRQWTQIANIQRTFFTAELILILILNLFNP